MTLRDLLLRLRALATPRCVERELDEELAFHIERETQKHLASGPSPADARTRALARFGSVPLVADQCRDARGIGFVDDVARDILYALRTFRRAPLAALTIVATVALGLGLVTAVFAIYDLVLLRADTVQSPGELFAVAMGQETRADNEPTVAFTRRDYEALRRETDVFTDAFAMKSWSCHRALRASCGRPATALGRSCASRRRRATRRALTRAPQRRNRRER
jgi:hypothetical protein